MGDQFGQTIKGKKGKAKTEENKPHPNAIEH